LLEKPEKLTELVSLPDSRETVHGTIQTADLKMFVRFAKVPLGKRMVNKVAGGTITFGDAPSPIKLYTGATDRKSVSRTIIDPAAKKDTRMAR
jgi:hypothetical protein